MKVRIFLETGKDDTSEKLFFENLLRQLNVSLVDRNPFVYCNGWTNLENQEGALAETDSDTKNIVIFDADYSNQESGGLEKRKSAIEKIKLDLNNKKNNSNRSNIDFDLFLMPNNKEDGCFETILEACFLPEHNCLFDCFDKFECCVKNKGYPIPNQKDKIYSCLDIVERKLNLRIRDKKEFWQFDNSQLWDMNCEAIKPLKEFLSQYTL